MAYQRLNTKQLEQRLMQILGRWDASDEQVENFRGWAYIVAAASDACAAEEPWACSELLAGEYEQLHQQIVEGLITTSVIDLDLVSRRAFVEFLIGELAEAERPMLLAA